ncbi:MAG: FAD-dependent oxidoreductase [Bacteroidetes bacterium]|nr:FAD-dependent oxidoreductase [Bacteroidota bacterium]
MAIDISLEREPSCLIVGAGIAGLMAARELSRKGIQVLVLDKARGVGGRMATRRFEDAVFDHGTQYFTSSSPWFQARIAEWIDDGITEEWFRIRTYEMDARFVSAARYRGKPAMTSIPKLLATGLNVQAGDRVTRLWSENNCWHVSTEQGLHHSASTCILTPPVPQTLELLAASEIEIESSMEEALMDLVYEPCLTLLAICEATPTLPEDGVLEFERGNLRRIMDNQRKGISPDVPAITIHATGAFSTIHFSTDDETVVRLLLEETLPIIRCGVRSWQLHRWRYSQILTPHPASFLQLYDRPTLAVAGDAFGVNGVEGAARSGMEAANMILRSFS